MISGNGESHSDLIEPSHSLDVRWIPCPYHSMRVMMFLEQIERGKILEVVMESGEPVKCISEEVRKKGYTIVKQEKFNREEQTDYRIWIC